MVMPCVFCQLKTGFFNIDSDLMFQNVKAFKYGKKMKYQYLKYQRTHWFEMENRRLQ